MGFIKDRLGRGKKASNALEAAPKSALEQAKEQPDSGTVAKVVQHLLELGIDGKGRFDPATKVAQEALAKHGGNADQAVDEIIGDHLKLAGANGFVTNLGGFAVMPVALPANVYAFYVLATRMAASVASVRGHDLTKQEVRSAILLSLVGADAQDVLAKAGMVAPTGRLTSFASQHLPGPALMVINKAVGFRILSQAGQGVLARFGKAIPVVGGAIGAGLDLWLLKQLADHVRTEFPAQAPVVQTPAVEGSAVEDLTTVTEPRA